MCPKCKKKLKEVTLSLNAGPYAKPVGAPISRYSDVLPVLKTISKSLKKKTKKR